MISDSNFWPETITAGGRTRTVSRHILEETHRGITPERVEYALENWVVRGIRTGADGRQSWVYLAFESRLSKMVRVAVSMDDTVIVTAFPDQAATTHWNRRNIDYFRRHYRNLEVRDAS